MKTNDDNILNDDSISISSLSEYTDAITSIRNNIIEDGKSETLFFRGQSNKSWDIRPSIFRDALISVEHKIIQTATARVPQEFRECSSAFRRTNQIAALWSAYTIIGYYNESFSRFIFRMFTHLKS